MKLERFENDSLDCKIGTFINNENEIYFRGKDVTNALDYKDTDQAIRTHVKDDDKFKLDELDPVIFTGLTSNEKILLLSCQY